MLEVAMLATAIVTAIFSGTPLLRGLWHKIRSFFGSACNSVSKCSPSNPRSSLYCRFNLSLTCSMCPAEYLHNIDRSRVESAMRSVLQQNERLRIQAQRRYIDDGDGSDFSDF
jgi:hypothetical protein